MAVDLTNRLALIKPRGGSSGSTPAEPVDVDQFNTNADNIDKFMGAPRCTSTTRPVAQYDGQLAYETDTRNIIIVSSGAWTYARQYAPWTDLPGLSSAYTAVNNPAYRIDGWQISLRGQLTKGSSFAAGDRLFTMTSGLRPTQTVNLLTRSQGSSQIYLQINTSGLVTVDSTSGTSPYIIMDQCYYYYN